MTVEIVLKLDCGHSIRGTTETPGITPHWLIEEEQAHVDRCETFKHMRRQALAAAKESR